MNRLETAARDTGMLQPTEQKDFLMTNELCERMLLTLDGLTVSGAQTAAHLLTVQL